MSYQRIDYTTANSELSSAYWEPLTGDAWDVYTRKPVSIVIEANGSYSESVPLPAIRHAANQAPISVTVRPYISVWMILPVLGFALGMLYLSQTYLH